MDDVHGPHCAAGVVEDPLLIQVDMVGEGGLAVQLADDVGDDAAGVVAVGGDGALGEVVQVVRVEDVEGLEALLEQVDDGAQQADEGREEEEETRHVFV